MRTSYVTVTIVVLVLIGGFVWYSNRGNESGPNTMAMPTGQTSQPATSVELAPGAVTISNFTFNPGTMTIRKGETVTWTNMDSVPHTVTSDTGLFASQSLVKGQSFSYTFVDAGTFSYHCAIHPNMKGSVVVQ